MPPVGASQTRKEFPPGRVFPSAKQLWYITRTWLARRTRRASDEPRRFVERDVETL